MKITKRDVKVFFLGALALLLVEVILDFDGTVGDFIRGFKAGYSSTTEKQAY